MTARDRDVQPRKRHDRDGPAGERTSFAARVRRAYVIGLSGVALLAICAFALLDDLIRTQGEYATTINVAGKQRMLSQRIGKLAINVVVLSKGRTPDTLPSAVLRSERDLLARSLRTMSTAHHALRHGDADRGLPGIRSDVERALYEGVDGVDPMMAEFLDNARLILDDSTDLSAILAARLLGNAANGPLLDRLERVVRFYEDEARERSSWGEMVHLGILLTTLALLLVEALLIFRPLTRELDRTERTLSQRKAELLHRSRHDQLTGLLNRHALRDAIEDGTIRAPYSVIAIDLDRFKSVNDEHGHEAGDDLLRDVGATLRRVLREGDAAVRIGGDEFVVVVALDGDAPVDIPGRIATRLCNAISDACKAHPERRGVSASAGYARHPENGEGFDEVLANADIALYQAKASGRNRVVEFVPTLRHAQERARQEETLIRQCIELDGFFPHFQPQVDMRSGEMIGIEALARGDCPVNGRLSPADFMDTAEATGLIVPLGRQVIEKAIRAAARWHHGGLTFGRVSVNASTEQLRDPTLPDFLRDTLVRHGLPAQCLAVEVVETVLLDERNEAIVECCDAIRRLGITIELDDFGTGFASIANVERLGVKRIKIDRSLLTDRSDRDVLGAVINMANGLKLGVLAEGVETVEDVSRLKRLGCYEAQGFHYARPMPAEDVSTWFAERRIKVAA